MLLHLPHAKVIVLAARPLPYSCRKYGCPTSYDVVTSWCDAIWRHIMSYYIIASHCRPMFHILAFKPENYRNRIFWPGDLDLLTLTIELVQEVLKVNPCTKFWDHMLNGLAARVLTHWHTHTTTDGSVFITSTADAGGNKLWLIAVKSATRAHYLQLLWWT